MGQVLSLALAVGVPLGVGVAQGLGMRDEVRGWYKTLHKPSWNPPDWLFGPVWSVLYTLMGVASWRVWGLGASALTLGLYGGQLALNLLWTPLFFKMHEIGIALADITALVGVLSATIVKFNAVDPASAYMLMPYLGWATFASVLNLDIYRRNPGKRGSLKYEKVAKDTKEATEEAARTVQAKAQEATDAAVPKVKEAYGAAKRAVGQGEAKAEEAADEASDRAHDAKETAKGKAHEAKETAKDKAR